MDELYQKYLNYPLAHTQTVTERKDNLLYKNLFNQ